MQYVIILGVIAVVVIVLLVKINDNSIVKECTKKFNDEFDRIKNDSYKYLQDWCKQDNKYENLINYINNQVNALSNIKNRIKSDRYTEKRLQKINDRTIEIQELKQLSEEISMYTRNLSLCPLSKMVDANEYGKCDKSFFDEVKLMNNSDVANGVNAVLSIRSSGNYKEAFKIDYINVIKYLWFYAMKKPFEINEYNLAKKAYSMVFEEFQKSEILLSEIYYIKQLGSDNIINDKVRDITRNRYSGSEFSILASMLMWVGAFTPEKTVLEHMVKQQYNLTPKQQTRLHALANSTGNAPNSHDVKSDINSFYIDISSISWEDEQYKAFFDNLAFQDKTLTYALAVRDEDRDLTIKKTVSIPNENDVLEKIRQMLKDEYGETATAELKDTVAISGASRERIKGVFVSSSQCSHLGIIVYLIPIGHKLNIKFYSAFVPVSSNMEELSQQALALKNNISPSATTWEKSLKEIILLSIQRLLNKDNLSNVQSKTNEEDEEVLM